MTLLPTPSALNGLPYTWQLLGHDEFNGTAGQYASQFLSTSFSGTQLGWSVGDIFNGPATSGGTGNTNSTVQQYGSGGPFQFCGNRSVISLGTGNGILLRQQPAGSNLSGPWQPTSGPGTSISSYSDTPINGLSTETGGITSAGIWTISPQRATAAYAGNILQPGSSAIMSGGVNYQYEMVIEFQWAISPQSSGTNVYPFVGLYNSTDSPNSGNQQWLTEIDLAECTGGYPTVTFNIHYPEGFDDGKTSYGSGNQQILGSTPSTLQTITYHIRANSSSDSWIYTYVNGVLVNYEDSTPFQDEYFWHVTSLPMYLLFVNGGGPISSDTNAAVNDCRLGYVRVWCSSAGTPASTPPLVQQTTQGLTASATTANIALSNSVTATDLLTVSSVSYSNTVSISGITGGGGTWSKVTGDSLASGGGAGYAEIWAAPNVSGASNSVVVTYNAALSSAGGVAALAEWSGVALSSPVDNSSASQGNGTNIATTSLSPTTNGDLFLAVSTSQNQLSSLNASWSELGTFSTTGNSYGDCAWLLNSGTSAQQCSWTQTNSGNYATAIAAFKPISGGNWTEVQTKSSSVSSGTTGSLAYSSSPVTGHVLVAVIADYDGQGPSINITDTLGNTWSKVSVSPEVVVFFTTTKYSGAETLNFSGFGGGGTEIYISEFIPPPGTVSQDGASSYVLNSGTSSSAACTSTVGSSDLLIAYGGSYGTAVSATSGFVTMGTAQGSGNHAYYALSQPGNTTFTYTSTEGTTGAGVVALIATGSGGSPSSGSLTLQTANNVTKLLRTNNPVVLKGVAVWGLPDHITNNGGTGGLTGTGFGSVQYQNRSGICSTIASWSGNIIRMRVLASDYVQGASGPTGLTEAQYVQCCVDWRNAAVANGLIIQFCDWDPLDGPYSGSAWAGEANRSNGPFSLFSALMAAMPGGINDPWVIYEPFNEPNNITQAQWYSNFTATWSLFRTTGYTGLLIADPNSYANSGTGGAGWLDNNTNGLTALENYDASLLGVSQYQTAFAKHDYGNEYTGNTWSDSAWLAAIGGGTGTGPHAVLESEIGNYNGSGNGPYPSWASAALTDFATKNSSMPNFIGWEAFLFGPWADANAMTTGITSGTNTWGGQVYAGLSQTTEPGSAPVLTVPPVITGTVAANNTLSCTTGTWQYTGVFPYTYQWYYGNTPISGATSSTYVMSASYLSYAITCKVTATNNTGSTTATSNALAASSGSPIPNFFWST